MDSEVAAYLARLKPSQKKLVTALRQTVRANAQEAEETVLWGGLSYHRPRVGGRVKGALCHICVKRGKVRLDFIHGIRLADPYGLLEGKLKSKRWLNIRSLSDIKRPGIAVLIREAAAIEWD